MCIFCLVYVCSRCGGGGGEGECACEHACLRTRRVSVRYARTPLTNSLMYPQPAPHTAGAECRRPAASVPLHARFSEGGQSWDRSGVLKARSVNSTALCKE